MADLSRRRFLQISLGTAAAATVLPACKSGPKELVCTDTSALAPNDLALRNALAYTDKTANPAQKCLNCIQYVAATQPGTCASCKLVKGPIHPEGYCKSWAAPQPA